ncbi:MAG TPA: type IX secretion system membrane protein PorP/SprF [Bacteroidales bacterium]|nr:type IX secretion system membrane protein PorP/SprF [Bacteroidales bacterium]
MKKLSLAFLLSVYFLLPVFSQQDPLSSHYMFNTLTYNPGVAGTSGMICATALNRQQWVGFEGAPSTIIFNVSAPVSPFRIKSGVGLLVESDNVGFDRDINITGTYSYILDLGAGNLGIGVSLGMLNKTINPSWEIPNGDSHVPASGDPLIPENKESFVAFDAGLGVYYTTDKYYLGASVTHINQPEIKFTKGSPYISRHYYLTAGYTIPMPNPSLELLPSIFAFSDGKVIQANATALIRYNKKVWGGVSFRAGDAIIGMIGFELFNGIRVGYAYDFTMSDIRKSSSGSHEFMVNYCFDLSLGKSPMKYKSIRFL